MRVGFGAPRRTLLIPLEQGSDSATQAEQPFDYRGCRLDSRDEYGPHVPDRATSAATSEPDCPHVLQWDVVQQCVHAKGARAEFTWVDSHCQALPSCGLKMVKQYYRARRQFVVRPVGKAEQLRTLSSSALSCVGLRPGWYQGLSGENSTPARWQLRRASASAARLGAPLHAIVGQAPFTAPDGGAARPSRAC